jgi:hypothetical protein
VLDCDAVPENVGVEEGVRVWVRVYDVVSVCDELADKLGVGEALGDTERDCDAVAV